MRKFIIYETFYDYHPSIFSNEKLYLHCKILLSKNMLLSHVKYFMIPIFTENIHIGIFYIFFMFPNFTRFCLDFFTLLDIFIWARLLVLQKNGIPNQRFQHLKKITFYKQCYKAQLNGDEAVIPYQLLAYFYCISGVQMLLYPVADFVNNCSIIELKWITFITNLWNIKASKYMNNEVITSDSLNRCIKSLTYVGNHNTCS